MTTYVALLRGINVGGNSLVSMAELRDCFAKMGFENVRTYINSGNVVFKAAKTDSQKLEVLIGKQLNQTFSLPIVVVVQSLPEMHKLVASIPASWQKPEGQKLNVIFLHRSIDNPNILDGLDTKQGIEELHYSPSVLFWSAQTSNLGKSNMVKLSSKPVYKQMTIRIYNTVRKIYQIMQEVDQELAP